VSRRTPYMVALGAGRVEVVKYLREVEEAADPEKAESFRPERKYCYNQVDEPWREFCSNMLSFKVPSDLDLIVPNPN